MERRRTYKQLLSPSADPSWWKPAVVLLSVGTVFVRCLHNQFVFDDHEMIVVNGYIGDWSFFWKSFVNDSWWFRDPAHLPQSSYYRPLQDIWLAVHYHIFGLNPTGYHATMVILHVSSVWLVFKIAHQLTRDSLAALFASLFFGLLPVHAEAVVWPAAIPLLLSAIFELSAFYLYLRTDDTSYTKASQLIFLGAALLTHESAVCFPLLIVAYVFFLQPSDGACNFAESVKKRGTFQARIQQLKRAGNAALPFAAVLLIYLALRLWILGFISRRNPLNDATFLQTAITIPAALIRYLTLLTFPWSAAPSHRFYFVTDAAAQCFYIPVIVLAVLVAVFALNRSNHSALYRFCAAWFIITLAPEMNLHGLFPQGLIQDRYLYLPSFAWCLMLSDLIASAIRNETHRRLAIALGCSTVAVYAFELFVTEHYWHDEIALFNRCIEESPEAAIWHSRLGMALEQSGDLPGALRELKDATRLEPRDGANLYNLGEAEARLGEYSQAAADVAAGLKNLPNAPPFAYISLAMLYDSAGNVAEAARALNVAAALPGGKEPALVAGTEIQFRHGNILGAIRSSRSLTNDFPNDVSGWFMLGQTQFARADYPSAIASYDKALKLAPNDATLHYLAAVTLYRMGRDDDALTETLAAKAAAPTDSRGALIDELVHNLSTR